MLLRIILVSTAVLTTAGCVSAVTPAPLHVTHPAHTLAPETNIMRLDLGDDGSDFWGRTGISAPRKPAQLHPTPLNSTPLSPVKPEQEQHSSHDASHE